MFVPAAILVALVISNLYAVNSAMAPKSRKALALVNIAALCFFALGNYHIYFNTGRAKIQMNFSNSCLQKGSPVERFDFFVNQASSVLCSKMCPCVDNGKEAAELGVSKRIQDCPQFKAYAITLEDQRFINMGEKMEREFQCSGICNPIDRFIFTDINGNSPVKSCGENIQDDLIKELDE